MLDPIRTRTEFGRMQQRAGCFLDSAASSQPLNALFSSLEGCSSVYANVHRGAYRSSQLTTEAFERTYNIMANLVNASSWREIILGKNATEMMNLVSYGIETQINDGDNIVCTILEHNSNYLPWKMLQTRLERHGVSLDVRLVPFDVTTGELDMEKYREMVDDRTKLVAVTGASNFLGTRPNLYDIVSIARESGYHQHGGSHVLVDGAQLVPHAFVDVQELDIDYLAWSMHKMACPLGIGALYGKQHLLEQLDSFMTGGDTIKNVTPDEIEWEDLPWRLTAGTPNILGTIAAGEVIVSLLNLGLPYSPDYPEQLGNDMMTKILMNSPLGDFEHAFTVPENKKIGMRDYFERYPDKHVMLKESAAGKEKAVNARLAARHALVGEAMTRIEEHEQELTAIALEGLSQIPGITIYGPRSAEERVGLVAFNIDGYDHDTVAFELDKRGVEVRNGALCASLARHALDIDGTVRMSFYAYTTEDDVRRAIHALEEIACQ